MTGEPLIAEVCRIRPREGAAAQLLALRDAVIEEWRQATPAFVRAELLRPEADDTWIDIYWFTSKQAAKDAFARADTMKAFQEWDKLVEFVGLEWTQVVASHSAASGGA